LVAEWVSSGRQSSRSEQRRHRLSLRAGGILGGIAQGEERQGEGGGGDTQAQQQGGAEDGA
jgi:hypothetical protein